MNCIDPPALTELDLALYLDGEADAVVAHHMATCPACRANATTLATAQRKLFGQLYRSSCPTPEELRDYQVGFLNRADRSNLALHVARCPHCTRELFLLQAFLNQPALATPPVTPLSATLNLLDQVKFFVATLVGTPGSPTPALAGQRGTSQRSSDPITLLYEAEDIQIGLEVVADPASGQQQLHGVVTSPLLENLLVHLWHNGQLIATASVDPLLGDFHFVNLPITATAPAPSDTYELIISAPQTKLHVPRLPLSR